MIAESPNAAGTMTAAIRLNCRALLVDDEPAQRFLLGRLLKDAGAIVETTVNGHAAILAIQAAMFEGHPFDIVLTDLNMPVVSGHGALKMIRRLGYRTPIIAVSSDNREEIRDRCLRAGFDAFVDKLHAKSMLVPTVSQLVRPRV